jgi:hypothetical protein
MTTRHSKNAELLDLIAQLIVEIIMDDDENDKVYSRKFKVYLKQMPKRD